MLIDLTHTIRADMPGFPGTATPILSPANTLAQHGFRETALSMTSHTGTHMDAPAHLLEGGNTLDEMDLNCFSGKALVLDCARLGPGRSVTEAFLRDHEAVLRQADFLLLRTGYEALWGTNAFFGDFPVPDEAAARYLARFGLKGLGTDAISIDPIADEALPVHRILLGAGMVSIENLVLAALEDGALVEFFALPLKYESADGAPVRAMVRLNEVRV